MLWRNFSSGLCGPQGKSSVSIVRLFPFGTFIVLQKCTKLPRFFLLDSQKHQFHQKSLPCNNGTYPETRGSYSFVGEGMVLKITFSFSALTPLSDLKAHGKKKCGGQISHMSLPFSSDKNLKFFPPKKDEQNIEAGVMMFFLVQMMIFRTSRGVPFIFQGCSWSVLGCQGCTRYQATQIPDQLYTDPEFLQSLKLQNPKNDIVIKMREEVTVNFTTVYIVVFKKAI